MSITAKDVVKALYFDNVICLTSQAYVGFRVFLNSYESDIAIISNSGYVTEIEVKVSVSDFRNEFKQKKKKHFHLASCNKKHGNISTFKHFYFAMPKEVYDKVKDEIPEYAGVYIVEYVKDERNYFNDMPLNYEHKRYCANRIKKAPALNTEKASAKTLRTLHRSNNFRALQQEINK